MIKGKLFPLEKEYKTEMYFFAKNHDIKRPYKIMVCGNGEKRLPKKGEWYLSGAIAEAYRAPNDLTGMSFYIAELVIVKEVTTLIVIDYIKDN